MKRFFVFEAVLIGCLSFLKGSAQPVSYPVAQARQYVHYTLNKIKKTFLAIDGKADDLLTAGQNEEVNLQLTYFATLKLDNLQKQIELDTVLTNTEKVTYLRGLGETLTEFADGVKKRRIRVIEFPETFKAWETAYLLDRRKAPIDHLIGQYSFATGTVLLQGISFMSNPGMAAAKNRLQLKYIEENPTRILQILNQNPTAPFTDSLVAVIAKREPENLYNYAQATSSRFGRRIQSNPDPAVKLICSLANDNSGQLYFPFLDGLTKGKITVPDIKKVMNDSVAYFRLLVKTQVEYAARVQTGDTPVVWNKLLGMLHNKAQPFINTINGLHEASAPVRFRILKPFSAKELYYLLVVSETEIYTSSYTNVYDSLWKRMSVPSADSLLAMVNNDHFKKFITMAANYNKLDNFLGRMSKEHSTNLMTSFVNNLDKGNEDDLEDAVDVANSYASITNDTIRKLMLDQIATNYSRFNNSGNHRGETVYRLENLILRSSDSASNINLSDSLGILPVYDVKNGFLKDSLGRIVLQMYFYGDEGGRGSFEVLKRLYANKNWKRVDTAKEWVQLNSVGSNVPFVIFANRPGDENKNEDELAQQHLNKWMDDHGYAPSITVHRGHSYYLKYTVEKMSPASKIVILGSCGAYHTMDGILKLCPEAYLIASKQTGYGAINIVLFTQMIEELKNGSDINWPAFWKLCESRITADKKEGFDDYIPPYKNLGAIFIKAYKKATEAAE